MKKGIVKFEDLPSIEGVVPVNEAHDFSVRALFVDFFVNVLHGFFVDFIDDDFDFVLRNLLLLKVLLNELACFVRRVIIDVHDVVILVVLHEHGIKVPEVKSVFNIIVRRNNNTESKLMFFIAFDVVVLIKELFFHFHDFFDCIFFGLFTKVKWRHLDIYITMKIDIMS